MTDRDHDLLIRIDEKLDRLIEKVDVHISDDTKRFDEVARDTQWTHKVLYGGLGVVAFLELASRFIK